MLSTVLLPRSTELPTTELPSPRPWDSCADRSAQAGSSGPREPGPVLVPHAAPGDPKEGAGLASSWGSRAAVAGVAVALTVCLRIEGRRDIRQCEQSGGVYK